MFIFFVVNDIQCPSSIESRISTENDSNDQRKLRSALYDVPDNRNNPYNHQRIQSTLNHTDRNDSKNYPSSVPTVNVNIDPVRHASHGNARTCVIEINIAVNLGNDRTSRGPLVTSSMSSATRPVTSTATVDHFRYIDLNVDGFDKVAQVSTDGFIQQASSTRSTAFP
jgi:hypothetical protein